MLGQLGLREPEPERRTTNHHPSPPSRMELHTMALSETIHEMSAFPDARYELYSWEFYKAYLRSPRPIDPPSTTSAVPLHVAQLGAAMRGRYPYLADEVARLARSKTAEQRAALGRRLLQMDAAALGSLEDRLREATRAGKEAMLAKLQSEVRYARSRIQAEAMVETIKSAAPNQK